jgi:hypothetical protein
MTGEQPLAIASEQDLVLAAERNLFALFRAMAAALPGGELVESDKLSRHNTFPTNPMFKGVWDTKLHPREVDAAIDECIQWFKQRDAPYMFWWSGPGTQPDDLGERLMQRGLISMEEQQKELAHGILQTEAGAPVMVAELHYMNETILAQTPPGFVIEEVQSEQSLYDFKKVFVDTYQIPEWAGQAWVDASLSVGIGRTPWVMYLGMLNGEPVATNMLFNGGGVASVYAVAAMPSVRGQGIGGAITLIPLLEARKLGYRYAVLFSSEMGVGAYRRIGFHLTEGRINRYMWRNE